MNCLDALSQQQLPSEQFEIIVVDDGNDEATAETVTEFARTTGIETRYLAQPQRRGMAAARNRGWKAARGRIIAFTEDDCLPQPDWLSNALAIFKRGAQVISGQVRVPIKHRTAHHDRSTAFIDSINFVTTNCFCLRSIIQRVGGFEEQFDIAWREDSDLQFKLLQLGVTILKCPDVRIIHPIQQSSWWSSLKEERKQSYDALLYKRHPELFKQRIPVYRSLVVRYYASVISVLIGLLALMMGNVFMAGAGFALWFVLSLSLIINRLTTSGAGADLKNFSYAVLTGLATPFLSVYWRLHGAVKYKVLYW
ncbi:glycosyltransferase [Nibrella saemangeumensis]|uniref:Glycosyltransferase n=2 Tax=Nibrella saemangeumensis TaxID=1084526 RepID=A0ABP8MMZ6_9BACT